MAALDSLRDRLAELADLGSLARLAGWDQRTMMPPAGGTARAYQMAAISRLAHDRGTAEEIGAWLDAVDGAELGDVDRDLVRVARRDWERERRVPADLAAERAQASAEGEAAWQSARAASDFAAFVPALRRNLELARAYADCLADGEHPYDALLADYDWGLTTARIKEIFGPLAEALPPLVAEAAARPDPPARARPRRSRLPCARRSPASASTTTAGGSTSRRIPSARR